MLINRFIFRCFNIDYQYFLIETWVVFLCFIVRVSKLDLIIEEKLLLRIALVFSHFIKVFFSKHIVFNVFIFPSVI
jgi:hypothetical protein